MINYPTSVVLIHDHWMKSITVAIYANEFIGNSTFVLLEMN